MSQVIFEDGTRGTVLMDGLPPDPDAMLEVLLDDGKSLFLPSSILLPHPDAGHHRVAAHPSAFGAGQGSAEEIIIPLVAETLSVGKREIETGRVRLTKSVVERTEVVDEPLQRTQTEVRRVPVGRMVEAAPAVRYEGETMIVSVVEEVLVVEKRLRLVEEVHIIQTQTEYHDPQTVTLRTETLTEERLTPGETPAT